MVDADVTSYQTVYADRAGAVAAPTAGLHFTPELLQTIGDAGTSISRITLHVGVGTFRPVTADRSPPVCERGPHPAKERFPWRWESS